MKCIKGQSCWRSITSAATLWHHVVFKEELTRAPDTERGEVWRSRGRGRGRLLLCCRIKSGRGRGGSEHCAGSSTVAHRKNLKNPTGLHRDAGFPALPPIIKLLSCWLSRAAVCSEWRPPRHQSWGAQLASALLCLLGPRGSSLSDGGCLVIGVRWTVIPSGVTASCLISKILYCKTQCLETLQFVGRRCFDE